MFTKTELRATKSINMQQNASQNKTSKARNRKRKKS